MLDTCWIVKTSVTFDRPIVLVSLVYKFKYSFPSNQLLILEGAPKNARLYAGGTETAQPWSDYAAGEALVEEAWDWVAGAGDHGVSHSAATSDGAEKIRPSLSHGDARGRLVEQERLELARCAAKSEEGWLWGETPRRSPAGHRTLVAAGQSQPKFQVSRHSKVSRYRHRRIESWKLINKRIYFFHNSKCQVLDLLD